MLVFGFVDSTKMDTDPFPVVRCVIYLQYLWVIYIGGKCLGLVLLFAVEINKCNAGCSAAKKIRMNKLYFNLTLFGLLLLIVFYKDCE